MISWFQSLELIEQIFAICAVPATLVLILQTVLLIIGLGTGGGSDLESDTSGIGDAAHGADFDADGAGFEFDAGHFDGHDGFGDAHIHGGGHDHGFAGGHDEGSESAHSHDAGFRMFTVRGFVTFFTLFGWTGLASYQSGLLHAISVGIAFAAGIAGMLITAWVMKSIMRLQSDGSINLMNALGKPATVYIPVRQRRTGKGKVNLIIQERLVEASAVTDEEFDLPSGSEVVVVGMSSVDTLLVAMKDPARGQHRPSERLQ